MADDPRIWFVCPDHDEPSGGVRGIYASVDHLNAAGVPSAVVHQAPGFRCTWFASDTRIVCADDIDVVAGRDLLVIPEIYGANIPYIGEGVPKAVFNRNAYNTFKGLSVIPNPTVPSPYAHPDVIAAVCVSDDNVEYLRHAFPRLTVERVVNPVDPALFHPEPKVPRITFMPRKHAEDAQQVLHMLLHRGALDGMEVTALQGMSLEQVAAVQRSALLFLSFGAPEGWGRPPAEAMACGAVVVGYHGMGGREFLTPEHAFPIPQGDIVGFARTVERLLDQWREDPSALEAIGARAMAAITARYTPEAERESVVRVFSELLERVAPGSLARR
jgi:hypothetical protein